MAGLGLAVMVLSEATRLYLGMAGNLSESVSELSTFWFLTLFIQLPLVIIYLITAWSYDQILDICAQLILGIFVAIELTVAFVTLRNVSRQHQFMSKAFWNTVETHEIWFILSFISADQSESQQSSN